MPENEEPQAPGPEEAELLERLSRLPEELRELCLEAFDKVLRCLEERVE